MPLWTASTGANRKMAETVPIERGADWGRIVARPHDLRVVADDAELAAALVDGSDQPTAPASGDLHRTVGGRDVSGLDEILELPVDLLRITLDDDTRHIGCASVVLRRPWWRGGWWRGDVVMVMNAEFLGEWHVVARGHPNDGRAESCSWSGDFGIRQRIEARRRLPTGTHVPHPEITVRSFRNDEWTFPSPIEVVVDGRRLGRSRRVAVDVLADAATIYA